MVERIHDNDIDDEERDHDDGRANNPDVLIFHDIHDVRTSYKLVVQINVDSNCDNLHNLVER